jgi:hypothetical protein
MILVMPARSVPRSDQPRPQQGRAAIRRAAARPRFRRQTIPNEPFPSPLGADHHWVKSAPADAEPRPPRAVASDGAPGRSAESRKPLNGVPGGKIKHTGSNIAFVGPGGLRSDLASCSRTPNMLAETIRDCNGGVGPRARSTVAWRGFIQTRQLHLAVTYGAQQTRAVGCTYQAANTVRRAIRNWQDTGKEHPGECVVRSARLKRQSNSLPPPRLPPLGQSSGNTVHPGDGSLYRQIPRRYEACHRGGRFAFYSTKRFLEAHNAVITACGFLESAALVDGTMLTPM